MAGLEIKYSKLTMVPDSTLMIGDIIATGETLIHCLRYVTDFYREHGQNFAILSSLLLVERGNRYS